MAQIKTTLTADDCRRYGANLTPTGKVKLSFPKTAELIGLVYSMEDADGNKTSNVQWAANGNGDVAPLDAVRKIQSSIHWIDGCLVADSDAITTEDLRWAEARVQEKLEWI